MAADTQEIRHELISRLVAAHRPEYRPRLFMIFSALSTNALREHVADLKHPVKPGPISKPAKAAP